MIQPEWTVAKPWQNPWRWGDLGCVWAKRRFPKLLKTLKVEVNLKRLWSRFGCVSIRRSRTVIVHR